MLRQRNAFFREPEHSRNGHAPSWGHGGAQAGTQRTALTTVRRHHLEDTLHKQRCFPQGIWPVTGGLLPCPSTTVVNHGATGFPQLRGRKPSQKGNLWQRSLTAGTPITASRSQDEEHGPATQLSISRK